MVVKMSLVADAHRRVSRRRSARLGGMAREQAAPTAVFRQRHTMQRARAAQELQVCQHTSLGDRSPSGTCFTSPWFSSVQSVSQPGAAFRRIAPSRSNLSTRVIPCRRRRKRFSGWSSGSCEKRDWRLAGWNTASAERRSASSRSCARTSRRTSASRCTQARPCQSTWPPRSQGIELRTARASHGTAVVATIDWPASALRRRTLAPCHRHGSLETCRRREPSRFRMPGVHQDHGAKNELRPTTPALRSTA